MNDTTTAQLEMRWLPITDAAGRTHMEAVWLTREQLLGGAGVHAA